MEEAENIYISKHQPVLHFLFPSFPSYSMSINIAETYQTRPCTLSTALVLSENTTITHIDLRKCGIELIGVDQLSTCLASLQHLDMSGNEISSKGVTNLGKLNYA